MFDICKNNQRVAQLHMTKTAYRLGEAVQGVLDFEHAVLPTYEVNSHTYISNTTLMIIWSKKKN